MAQLDQRVGDLAANARAHPRRRRTGPARHAQLVVTPELSLCGYPPEDLAVAAGVPRRVRARARGARRRVSRDEAVVVGFPGARRRRAATTRRRCCARARCEHVYRKQALPNYTVFDEERYFTPGDGALRVRRRRRARRPRDLRGRLAPGSPPRRREGAGAQLIVVPNGSPYHTRQQARSPRVQSRRARANAACRSSTSIASAARTSSCSTARRSSSMRGGALAQQIPAWHETIAIAEFDGAAPRPRARHRSTGDSKPTCTTRWSWACATTWTRTASRARSSGCPAASIRRSRSRSRSTRSDAIACARVMLPSRYNARDQPRGRARRWPRIHGVRYDEIADRPDRRRVRASARAASSRGCPRDATEENIQARIRGTLLMALSNKHGSIVLTTGNKSEMAVGYATLYGDMAGGFAVLKDITQDARVPLVRIPQPPGPRHPGARHHARAVGRAARRPDRPGLAAALRCPRRRSSRPTWSATRAPSEIVAAGFRRAAVARGRAPHQAQRIQAPAVGGRHPHHAARVRQGLARIRSRPASCKVVSREHAEPTP